LPSDSSDAQNISTDLKVEWIPEVYLTREQISDGLSQLARTADGISHAFVRLEVKGKGLTLINVLDNYQHLRYLDFSDNKISSLKPIGGLENLIAINCQKNQISNLDGISKRKF
jgi:Leucine-rich repeat (LRR) protein